MAGRGKIGRTDIPGMHLLFLYFVLCKSCLHDDETKFSMERASDPLWVASKGIGGGWVAVEGQTAVIKQEGDGRQGNRGPDRLRR